MLGSVVSLLVRLVELGGSAVGVRHGTEEPRYTVEQQIPGVEIRRYGPRIAAETAVAASEEAARNVGFRRLARYIFGANHAAAKIAMTAPGATAGQRAWPEDRDDGTGVTAGRRRRRMGDPVFHARRQDHGIASRARR